MIRLRQFLSVPFILCLCSSCGYHFEGPSRAQDVVTLSIPYVTGDSNGLITDELIKAFAASGAYQYRSEGGSLELRVSLVDHNTEQLGWRYQRNVNGELKHELIATEARRHLTADVTLLDGVTEEILYGPVTIQAYADYDYYEPDSIQDLSFIDSFGVRQTSVRYSLGQLDSSEGASDAVLTPLGRQLAKKIVDRILRNRY
ncbi:MAG: hypothetical protein KGZ39_06745 [Simkania sp.]|nr:hypothetical protein [Simkania sp.]